MCTSLSTGSSRSGDAMTLLICGTALLLLLLLLL
jgi:hypothetical protein